MLSGTTFQGYLSRRPFDSCLFTSGRVAYEQRGEYRAGLYGGRQGDRSAGDGRADLQRPSPLDEGVSGYEVDGYRGSGMRSGGLCGTVFIRSRV
jgi:hypothetical protein